MIKDALTANTASAQAQQPLSAADASRCDPAVLFPNTHVGIFRFVFAVSSVKGRPTASAWRGALGWELRRKNCGTAHGDVNCPSCRRNDSCVYFYLYELTTGESGLKNPPRPYVLGILPSDDTEIVLELKLFNQAAELINTLAEALADVASAGVDAQGHKVRGRLRRIEQVVAGRGKEVLFYEGRRISTRRPSWPLADYLKAAAPPRDTIWEIWLHTPVRLRKSQTYLQQPDWPHAFQGLAVRLSALETMNSGHRLNEEQWKTLMDFFAQPGNWIHETTWRDWHRRSSRQDHFVPMGGIIGRILLQPPSRLQRNWWQWWKTAEIFNLGKGTTMGNGRIRIRPSKQQNRTSS